MPENLPVPLDDSGDALERHEAYMEYRRELLAASDRSVEAFDQAVLTLSSAALGLSLVFIKDVVEFSSALLIPALVVSWVAFGVAILSTMASFMASRIAMEQQLRLAKRGYIDGDASALEKTPKASTWTVGLNRISAGAFAAGVILTILFVTINILGS